MRTLGMWFLFGFSTVSFACSQVYDSRYCDSSAHFMVNDNGDYGSAYCTRHAVMDLQKTAGLCIWHGGLASIGPNREVICNDGTYSEIGSLYSMQFQEAEGFYVDVKANQAQNPQISGKYLYQNGIKVKY